ncbi:MFS transporter [Saccharolobus solfataricus]|uniref:Permease, putative n=3 Tax=Saccharolobus solfataricus TaxID=2287 RepID=Q97U80_SACS2|nr:MFS transporter [Saccharolobus solfataricus]AAK43241.1 Permease, putative [Saccharolobus solfataricus P2]AKA73269.1 MFS transporter [Saccharolobus solfataricus]AKA75968.1 MFS transporter [Saccharolobus solfataricus]AKA78661.1 MFS transporter [Saccharolobus solfataricus]AZF67736.1 MFS transporter [Saccharolobus solfataricus]
MSIAGRIERLPWTSFHTRLLAILTLGEFFELYDLFTGGFVASQIASFYKVSSATGIYYTVAIFFLGAFVGAIIFNYIGDSVGRRTALIINMTITSIALLLIPFSPNILTLGILRFLAGVGVGPEAILVLDVLVTEFFPSNVRGKALAIGYTIAWTAPIVVAVLAYFLLPHKYFLYGWQWLFIIGGLGILTIIPFRFLIPESPRWLESKGRLDEAEKTVRKMEEIAIKEKGQLGEPIQVQVITSQRVKISELFSPLYRKRTVMLWIFEFLQAGVYYGFASLAPSVLFAKGFTLVHTLQYTMIIYTSYFISSLASIFIIDSQKFDRKWQVSIVMLLMGLVGLAFGFSSSPLEAVVTGFTFGFLSNIFSNAFHQYGAELYPTRVRAFADGVQYSLSRLGNYIWLTLLPIVLYSNGPVAMYTIVFIMALIVTLDVAILGPKASKIELEELSK